MKITTAESFDKAKKSVRESENRERRNSGLYNVMHKDMIYIKIHVRDKKNLFWQILDDIFGKLKNLVIMDGKSQSGITLILRNKDKMKG